MTALSFAYAGFTPAVFRLKSEVSPTAATNMGLFRISRPITVDARQSVKAETIATDLGFTNVNPGDWVIRGEGGESYILSNDFFQRTFAPVDVRPLSRESRGSVQENHSTGGKTVFDQPGRMTRPRVRIAMSRRQKVKQSI